MKIFGSIFKIFFMFVLIPIIVFIRIYFNIKMNSSLGVTLTELILTIIIMDILLITDFIKNRDYRKYKIENPDKLNVNWFALFFITFSVFYIPYALFYKLIMAIDNIMWQAGITTFYVIFTIFYATFVYKIAKNHKKFNKKVKFFQRIKDYSYLELISLRIQRMSFYNKIMIFENRIFIVCEAGIFEIIEINKVGIIKGDIKNNVWHFNDKEIKNPFALKGDNTYHYFIKNKNITFEVIGVGLIDRENLAESLERYEIRKVFDKNMVDKMYNDLEVKYGCYQNKLY